MNKYIITALAALILTASFAAICSKENIKTPAGSTGTIKLPPPETTGGCL